MAARKAPARAKLRFESVKIDSLFEVLDATAWLDSPTGASIAQFANIDPRTAGKILKNAKQIGLITSVDGATYMLSQPYPYKGTAEQKNSVVREALLKHPLIIGVRQFLTLGNDLPTALRKAATVAGEDVYDPSALAPLINWAKSFGTLNLDLKIEGLLEEAVVAKQERHTKRTDEKIAFISHSSKDKKFVRQLASDLVAANIRVWIDEQQIQVGDSIPDKVAQGLAESDFYLIVVSQSSVESQWVRKELNGALVREIERRDVNVLPIKLDDAPMPESIADKRYANFSENYASGLKDLIQAIEKGKTNDRRKAGA
jgi:hypothetical protein